MNTQNLGIVSPVAMGDWQENFQYQKLNIVRHNGSSYIAKSENSGIEPGVESGWSAYWMLLNTDVEGAQGPQGPAGEGVPTGGLAGQVLSKNSDANYDTKWIPQSQIAAGSAVKDGQGNNIPETYETKQHASQTYEPKLDAATKNSNLQIQITQNQNSISSNTEQISEIQNSVSQNSALISRNSKRLDGLEQRINPSPFVTDSSVAYQKDIPENAVGAVEIQKIGGMTYKDGNTLKSAKVTEVKSVGVNIWDEELESGYINLDTGNKGTDATCSRSVNFISVEPSTTYYLYNGSWDQTRVAFYDSSNNYIGYITTAQFTTPANCRYIRFYWVGTEYNNDICINKSNVAINGKYYPYVEHTLPIPEAVRPANGINENVYDFIEWAQDGSVKKTDRCKKIVVDGSADEDWGYSTDGLGGFHCGAFNNSSGNIVLSSRYSPRIYPWGEFETIGITKEGTLWICAPRTSIEEWRSQLASNPIEIVYELAEPIVADISDLITSDNLLSIQGGGTLTFENEYGYDVPSTVEYITAEATA